MVNIECLVCGEIVKIPKFIDTDNYDGQVVCQNCTSLLHIKLVESKVKKYRLVKKNTRKFEQLLEKIVQAGKQSDG